MQQSNSGVEGEVPHTFRQGPSNPVVFADGPGTYVETRIAAPVDDVWAMVTDIDLPAQFSEEFLGATWKGDGPGLGASFIGRSQHPAVGEWETESFVDEFDPGRVFGWAVIDTDNPGARWRFSLEPSGEGTVLRFEVSLGPGPSGTTMVIASMPDKEARIINRRLSELHANMTRTVDGIRQILEKVS
jgi:hypothetical protein